MLPDRISPITITDIPIGPELAIVVPTFNESGNVEELVARLCGALQGLAFEIIVVDDDSPDGTAEAVRRIGAGDMRVRCLQRVGRRGLSGAVIEGMLASTAPVVAVIDGDLQHDETLLPQMYAELRRDDLDLVVASRYVSGGSVGDWSDARHQGSKLATRLARRLTGVTLHDPMSGFFMLRSDALRARARGLSGVGYKLLLDILATPGPALSFRELPYRFQARQQGESKLDTKVLLEYIELLLAKTVGRYVPVKFVMFSLVGALGLLVHMAVLGILFKKTGVGFSTAQTIATLVAMTANFFVNNIFTYFDRRLRGWKLLPGWLSFCAASSVGALANVGVAVYLFQSFETVWYLSALAGVIVGATWNYAVTALYTWK
ncbi:MAG: glycosyltransferase family 2 protein [Rhodobacter sp.]|nr:glycosyltransferase family 2 protein [Rhodobacter sp.]